MRLESSYSDKKKAAILGLSALGSILVSYFVYKHVVEEDSPKNSTPDQVRNRRNQSKRSAAHRRQGSRHTGTPGSHTSNKSSPTNRIVGASHRLRNRGDELTEEEKVQLIQERME